MAGLIEGMMSLSAELREAASSRRTVSTGPRDRALRRARVCYDHLAGEVAVAIADRMVARGQLEFGQDGGVVTEQGWAFLNELGVDFSRDAPGRTGRAPFCRPCLDWSERRPHVAGLVGRAMYDRFTRRGWIRRSQAGRVVSITPLGASELSRHFGLKRAALRAPPPPNMMQGEVLG